MTENKQHYIFKIGYAVEVVTHTFSDGAEASMVCEYDAPPTDEDIRELIEACRDYAESMEFDEKR